MFTKSLVRVWVGILALSSMFLLGQDFWIEPSDVRYVFVTDLGSPGSVPIEIADDICQTDADEWGLPGTYKAWLSDSSGLSPDTRFDKGGHPYRLPSGLKLAEDWDDLTDGVLAYNINEYADGSSVASFKPVWTNTLADGTAYNPSTPDWDCCFDWSSENVNDTGIVALVNHTGNWSTGDTVSCGMPPWPHYFCFGQ